MNTKLLLLSFSILFPVLISAQQESQVDAGLKNQIMHVGNGAEPQGLDPHIVTGVPEHHLLITMCEGLTSSNPKGGAPLPGMAESWTISDDGKIYTFNINPEAKWSNGDSVTANDFVWSWMRILTPTLGSQYPDMLYYVKGAKDFNQKKITDFSKVGVKALDDLTLVVELNNPTPFFLGLLSHYATWPVHKETVLKFGSIDDRRGEWTKPGNFVCNGAMQLKLWEVNNKIVVERNPFYWDAEKVKLNEIHFYPVANVMTEERMFRSGQLHTTSVLPASKCSVYINEKNPNLRIDPYMGTYFYRTNTNHPVLKDKRVRKALAYSINRKIIVEKVTKCGQIEAYSFTPPGSSGYEPGTSIPYDPALARKLLEEAGYKDGKGFPELEILFNTNEDHKKIATVVQQMWQTALGIKVKLANQDWKVYLDRERSGDFQISRAGWIGDYEDPNTFLDTLRSGRGNNKTGWSNVKYDQLIEQANTITDTNLRFKLLQEAENILIDEMPIIPIYTYVRAYQISTDVKGFDSNYLDHHHPKYIYLERPSQNPVISN